MRFLKPIVLVSAAFVMTACATPTAYQIASAPGKDGYASQQIESNRYSVSFAGNSLTERETVETYLLHRAAELTVENGYDYFTVVDEETEKNTRIVSTPAMGYGFRDPFYAGFYTRYDYYHPRFGWRSNLRGYRSRFYDPFYAGFGRGFYDPFYRDFDYREITKFKADAEIVMGKGAKPSSDIKAFNAREVLANLGPKIVYPEVRA